MWKITTRGFTLEEVLIMAAMKKPKPNAKNEHRRNNPCYRRESGMAKRNSNKPHEHGPTGWRLGAARNTLLYCVPDGSPAF
jgi:hypothetical protein